MFVIYILSICLLSLFYTKAIVQFIIGLETQLGPVVAAISKNKSIKKLNIGRNLNNIKSKHVYHVMEAVMQMIQVRIKLDLLQHIELYVQ